MSTLIRQRALQSWVLSICIIAVLLSLNFFYIETAHSFLHSLLNFYCMQKFVWFCYLVVFISTLLFANSYLFYLVLLLKITLFNTVHCDGKNLTRDETVIMLRVEKVRAHAAFWENLWAKAGPNQASIDSSEKRIMLDYQLTVLLVKVVRRTFSENSEPVWDVHMRIHVAPPSVLPTH